MGDLAEDQCRLWLEAEGRGYVEYGLNRPPLRMSMLPAIVRHTPDFLTSRDFIECKGFGRDQILKVKLEDWDCWQFWNRIHPLSLFFYDSSEQRTICISFKTFRDWLSDSRIGLGTFPEGKPYFSIPAPVVFDHQP
jgi:hypothetical protein